LERTDTETLGVGLLRKWVRIGTRSALSLVAITINLTWRMPSQSVSPILILILAFHLLHDFPSGPTVAMSLIQSFYHCHSCHNFHSMFYSVSHRTMSVTVASVYYCFATPRPSLLPSGYRHLSPGVKLARPWSRPLTSI